MYIWIWRHLPGGTAIKGTVAALLVLGPCSLLFFVVFPYIEPRLPLGGVTIEGSTP